METDPLSRRWMKELYHLGNDIGEQNDLIAKEKKRAKNAKRNWTPVKRQKLNSTPDPKFDSVKEKPAGNIESSEKQRLEKQHAFPDPIINQQRLVGSLVTCKGRFLSFVYFFQ